jgi:signal transduction histidine kinase
MENHESLTARLRRVEEERASLEAQLRQAQKMEAMGTLAGGIAHDFNNILAAIMAYTDLALMEPSLPPTVRGLLTQIMAASDRAKDLVQQILTFSRQQKQERKPLLAQRVVADAVKFMRSTLPATIEIKECIDPNAPTILADATQINQIVINLCTNAVHAMKSDPRCLKINFAESEMGCDRASLIPGMRAGHYVRLSVSDTGHGIDPEIMQHIFEPFFTTKKPGEGTGLGLSVVRGIVRSHEGAIDVRSRPGEGTTFDIYLPVKELTRRASEKAAVFEGELKQAVAPLQMEFGANVRPVRINGARADV